MSSLKKYILIVCGTLCVILAVLGVILPILPTTPFLLLAAACYARSSQRFYDWLLNNRLFGRYIRNYREGRGITLPHKIVSISLLWLTILASAIFAVSLWWVRILLVGIAAGVTTHLLSVPTCRMEDWMEQDEKTMAAGSRKDP